MGLGRLYSKSHTTREKGDGLCQPSKRLDVGQWRRIGPGHPRRVHLHYGPK